MHIIPSFQRVSTRVSRIVLAVLALVGVTLVVMYGLISLQLSRLQPRLVPMAQKQLGLLLGREVRIGAVRLGGVNQVVASETAVAAGPTFAAGTAFTAPEVVVHVDLFNLLLHQRANPVGAIDQVVIRHPRLDVSRSLQGQWDFADVVQHVQARMRLIPAWHAQLVVEDGDIAYHDAHGFGVGSLPIQQEIADVSGSMLRQGGHDYAFDVAAADAGQFGHVRVKGLYSINASEGTRVDIDADRVAMNELARWLPKNLPITFSNGSAALRLSALIHSLPAPGQAHKLSRTELTADVDLSGIGLRLHEMSAPIVATSGRLRLVLDGSCYPDGSRLEFHNVQARAVSHFTELPVAINGAIDNINLCDLAHIHPRFAISLQSTLKHASVLRQLFPGARLLHQLGFNGGLTLNATVQGDPGHLQVDGKIHSEYVTLPNFQATDVLGTFHLLPGAEGSPAAPTLRIALHADHARLSQNTDIADIALLASSTQRWKQLADDPEITGALSVAQMRASWGDADQIWGTYHADAHGVRLDTLKATTCGGQLAGTAQIPFKTAKTSPPALVTASGNYTGIDLARLGKKMNLATLSGTGKGLLTLAVHPDGLIAIDTTLNGNGVHWQKYHASSLNVGLHIEEKHNVVHVDIAHANAQTDYGVFTAEGGHYDHDPSRPVPNSISLSLHGEKMPLQRYGYPPLTGQATLDGTLAGDAGAPVLQAQFTASNGSLLGRAFTSARGEVTVGQTAQKGLSLRLRNLVLTRPDMIVSIPGGNTGFDPRMGLVGVPARLTVHGASFNEVLGLFQQQSPLQVDGGTDAAVTIENTGDELDITGMATIAHPVLHLPRANGTYALALDQLKLNFAIDGRRMQIYDLEINHGDTVLHAQGLAASSVGGPISANLLFHSTQGRLQDFPQPLFGIPLPLSGPAEVSGTLQGVLNGTGPSPLTVQVSVHADMLQAAGLPAGAGAVDLTYRYRPRQCELSINHATVDNPAFHAVSEGLYQLDRQQFDGVWLSLNHVDLAVLQPMLARAGSDSRFAPVSALLAQQAGPLSGGGQLRISADGNFAHPAIRLGFGFSRLALGDRPLPALRGNLSTTSIGGPVHVGEIVASGDDGGNMRVTGNFVPNGNLQLNYTARHFSAKSFAPWSNGLLTAGTLDSQGSITGSWKSPIIDAGVQLNTPTIGGRPLQQVSAHLHEDARRLTIADGMVLLTSDAQPVSVQGELPLGWSSLRQPVADQPLSLAVYMPRQSLGALRAILPSFSGLDGTIAGDVHVTGTLARPRFNDGHIAILGAVTLPIESSALPSRLQNVDLRADITNDGRQSQVKITRFVSMPAGDDGVAAGDASQGWITSDGTIGIPNDALFTPMRWHWDVYARLQGLSITPDATSTPQASGLFHLADSSDGPLITGVALLEHAQFTQPDLPASSVTGSGTPLFNPRLSVVLQVGAGIKLVKGFFAVPLQTTPLPRPSIIAVPPGAMPSTEMQHSLPAYRWNATMLHPGAAPTPGTWGVITGSLYDPHLYARFAVDKQQLTFPLNMIGSIRNACGQITYSFANGAHVTTGAAPI